MVVDALPVARRSLRLALEDAGLTVEAEASSASDALAVLQGLDAGQICVLVSVQLAGDHDAFWLLRAIRNHHPTVRLLAYGGHAPPVVVSRALFSGADGFLDQAAETERFVAGILEASSGEMVLVGVAPDALGSILRALDGPARDPKMLSRREIEVLQTTAGGLTARQAARLLGLKERTVTTHLGRIYAKLGVHGHAAAVSAAVRAGLITLTPARHEHESVVAQGR